MIVFVDIYQFVCALLLNTLLHTGIACTCVEGVQVLAADLNITSYVLFCLSSR